MATKVELTSWTVAALRALGGSAHLIDVAKWVWANHADELRRSGNLFYTWQYDLRWAATELRKDGRMTPADVSPRGVWQLVQGSQSPESDG